VCPKSQGATRKIRPRTRNSAFHPRDHDPIGAVSRVLGREFFFHRTKVIQRGIFIGSVEIETESRVLKPSISTVRKFPVYRKPSNKTR
jgi:hypothetical protein